MTRKFWLRLAAWTVGILAVVGVWSFFQLERSKSLVEVSFDDIVGVLNKSYFRLGDLEISPSFLFRAVLAPYFGTRGGQRIGTEERGASKSGGNDNRRLVHKVQ